MTQLWGQDIGHVKGEGKPASPLVVPASNLSKRCRRILEIAYERGGVVSRGGGFHFNQLVVEGYLNDDGSITTKGRRHHEGKA